MKIKKKAILDVKKLSKEKYKIDILSQGIPNICQLTYKNKKYLIERIGECDYKKCNSACCRFFYLDNMGNFADGFFEKVDNAYILKKNCKYLSRYGKCSVWKKENWPGACRDFPILNDKHYVYISEKCTIKFKVLGEII